MDETTVREGIAIIAEVVEGAFRGKNSAMEAKK